MRKYVIALCILLSMPAVSWAQNKVIAELAEKYSGRDGFSTTVIKGEITSGVKSAIKMHNIDITDLMSNISSITLITSDKPDKQFSEDVKKATSGSNYSTVMSMSENGEQIKFLLAPADSKSGEKSNNDDKKGNPPENEFVMVVLGPKENMLISIVGNYKIKQISKSNDSRETKKTKTE